MSSGGTALRLSHPTLAMSAAAVLSAEPDSHLPVAGQFDLERIDGNRLAVCWAAYDDHARLLAEYRAGTRRCRWPWSSAATRRFCWRPRRRCRPTATCCAVAGLLREKPLDVVACRGVDLTAPAEAEIILEGFCDPGDPPIMAGPFWRRWAIARRRGRRRSCT